ncbi:MAG: hypothetical protein LBP58_06465, partial [Azoarcus sp.]|nr:hypothetical protein [Azoarcus sp.]
GRAPRFRVSHQPLDSPSTTSTCIRKTSLPVIPATPPVSAGSRRRVDCHGPAALAMTGWEIRHCEA